MAIAFGPINPVCTGPLGSAGNQTLVFDTGQVGAKLVSLSCAITGAGVTGDPGSAWGALVDWVDHTDATIGSDDVGTHHFNTSNSATLSGTAPTGATRAVVYFQAALAGSDAAAAFFSGSFVTRDYCEYGTQIGSAWPALVQLTPTLVNGAIALRYTGPAGILAQFVIGDMLDVVALCSVQRVDPPTWTLDDLRALNVAMDPAAVQAAGLKLRQWIKWLMWPTFCECTPGGVGQPDPIPPPDIIRPLPPGMEDDPTLPVLCDNDDICTTLNQISFRLASLSLQLSRLRGDVNLIQRQGVPFAYIQGPSHGPFSGTGQFTVEDILGLAVSFSAIAPSIGSAAATPVNYWRLGELSLGTPDGWVDRQLLHHQQQVVLPIGGEITKVGYTLEVGCTATFTELVREAPY